MSNQVFLSKDGFIYHVYEGNQTAETMGVAIGAIRDFAKELRKENKSVKVIGNYTQIGKADTGARKAANDALKSLDYDKIALFGTSVFHKIVSNLIIQITGQSARAQVFNTEKDALTWLNK